ncbi:MAG: hypothetical protein R3F19_18080 [Verrucomicrobiales bacterium]
MDELIRIIERFPELLDNHGTEFCLITGTVFCFVGYIGAHCVNRRQFYRRQRGSGTPPTYFQAWSTSMAETFLGFVFIGSMMFGFLCLFAGIVDWIDG